MMRAWILVMLILFSGTPADAEDKSSCVIMTVGSGGRVLRGDGNVGATLKRGDVLYASDRVKVPSGSAVDIAFDPEGFNLVRIEGPASVLVAEIRPTRLELSQGELFAKLDKQDQAPGFKVSTPTAVAAVRGTRFQARYVRGLADVFCYRGYVRVSGRDREGRMLEDSVLLRAGQKTEVRYRGQAPEPAADLTEREKDGFGQVLAKMETARGGMDEEVFLEWIRGVPEDTETKEKPTEGFVVY